MTIKLSEEFSKKIKNTIEKLLNGQRFPEVCRFKVLIPNKDTQQFQILIYFNLSVLENMSSYDKSIIEDEITNKSWNLVYDYLQLPSSVFIWKERC